MIRPIYGQNFRSKFRYLTFCPISKKQSNISKKAITLLQRPLGRNPFRLLLVSLRPACGPNMSSNGGCHLKRFPRQRLLARDRRVHFFWIWTRTRPIKLFRPGPELFILSIDFFNLKLSVGLKIRDAFIRLFVSNDQHTLHISQAILAVILYKSSQN